MADRQMAENAPARARALDEIEIGETAETRRTVTANDLVFYSHASGDLNPLHLPEIDGDGDGRPEAFAPAAYLGGLVAALVARTLPGPGSRALRWTGEVGAPLSLGQTAAIRLEVTGKDEKTVTLAARVDGPDGTAFTGELVVAPPENPREFEGYALPDLLVRRHPHFDRLLKACEGIEAARTAVVCPESEDSLHGALMAADRGLIKAVLVGRPEKIEAAAGKIGRDLSGFEIVEAGDAKAAAETACRMVAEGEAASIMKGHLHTDTLLRAVLNRAFGLRGDSRVSHCFVMDVPGMDRLILVTDAAVNIEPDLAAKADIVQNAIDLACALGVKTPRAAVLSAVETINPALTSTLHAAALAKMADRGQIRRGLVDGPLAMDNAVDPGAAKVKKLKGEVAGRAEILVAPDIEAGNMLAKELTFIARAESAGVVIGARAPVILTSRADNEFSRLMSCAVAALHAVWLKTGKPAPGLTDDDDAGEEGGEA
ncbi:MAG: bifunctional enoyl-CoA hydratase/phosphate acetyltransferase [Oceanicaulis sp.]